MRKRHYLKHYLEFKSQYYAATDSISSTNIFPQTDRAEILQY